MKDDATQPLLNLPQLLIMDIGIHNNCPIDCWRLRAVSGDELEEILTSMSQIAMTRRSWRTECCIIFALHSDGVYG